MLHSSYFSLLTRILFSYSYTYIFISRSILNCVKSVLLFSPSVLFCGYCMCSPKCYICKKRVNSSVYTKSCFNCLNVCHALCLPGVTKFDDFYVNQTLDWYCNNCVAESLPYCHIMDNDLFSKAIFELRGGSTSLSLFEMEENIFNPFELNFDYANNPLIDADPDLN